MQEVTPSFAFRRGEGVFVFSPAGHVRQRTLPAGCRTLRRECLCSFAVLPRRVVHAVCRFLCRFSLFRVFPFVTSPERTIMCEEKHEAILRRRRSRQWAMKPRSGAGPPVFPFFLGAPGASGMSGAFGRYWVAGSGPGSEVVFDMVCFACLSAAIQPPPVSLRNRRRRRDGGSRPSGGRGAEGVAMR